jgi:catechol 2,3-dioxygenase-like lactoylglutathione lyase family enzyme
MQLFRAAIAACVLVASAPAAASAVGACHVGPSVADLDRSVRFYRDAIGLDVSPEPTTTAFGLPQARLRSAVARVPGARCGIELVEFGNVDRSPVRRRMQDPGAITLILLVRDIDAAFARVQRSGAKVVTTGGRPVLPSPTSKSRAVIVEDPDGYFVELAQLVPAPAAATATTMPASSNVFDIRFRVTVSDVDQIAQHYRDRFGIAGKPGAFAPGAGVMAMMGLPDTVEYRMSVSQLPGSTLILEFLELKGIERRATRVRVQDPGAYRLQLDVDRVEAALESDPNNLFLVLRQQ